ncbi:MAG: hypothetical protein GX058_01690 [Firmicutes bacterium]|nr:hypothetical protein [Bacillota bacterium]
MKLAQPSWELATKILGPLKYDEWITGYLIKSSGEERVEISSFADAVRLLDSHKIEDFSHHDLLFPGVKKMLAWIDPQQLMEWVRTVFCDWELALAIKQVLLLDGHASYPEQIKSIRELMQYRLRQAVSLVEAQAKSAC